MNPQISQALIKLFDRHRIIFWYDAKRQLRDDFEALSLPGIDVARHDNRGGFG